jgi:adenine-specific DNA glycosylase
MHEEQEVTQTTPETDSAAEFEELIQGRCKQPFQQRVQKILDGRLRSLRQENEALRRQAAEQLAEWGIIPHRWGKSFTEKHIFTHITWEMTVFTITVQGAGPPEWVWCPDEEREKYPMPTAFGKLEKE